MWRTATAAPHRSTLRKSGEFKKSNPLSIWQWLASKTAWVNNMKTQADILLEVAFKAQKEFVSLYSQREFDAIVYLIDDYTITTLEQLSDYRIEPDGSVS